MALSSAVSLIVYFIYLATLVVAAVYDARHYRIPNALSLAVVAITAAAMAAAPTVWFWGHLGAGLLVFSVGFVLAQYGVFGGGDVKLWAAAALWQGFETLAYQAVAVALSGAVLAIVLLGVRALLGRFGGEPVTYARIFRPGEPVPYGIAIAIGSIFFAQDSPLVSTFTAFG
jgi:prepilin peptidase CpaA